MEINKEKLKQITFILYQSLYKKPTTSVEEQEEEKWLNNDKFVAFYIRVSTDRQAQEGYSLDAQKEENLALAKRIFGPDVRWVIYADEGKSGKNTDKRPNLQRMMQDIKAGKIQAVITYKVSRLSRSLSDSLNLVEQIHRAKVRFISVKEGEYGTPHGNLQFNILAAVAQYQREDLAENVQSGMTQRAKEGYWNGGQVLGYQSVDKQLVVVPEEAEIVKLIFHKFVNEGWGTKRIANYLNLCGYKTKKGKPFSITSVTTILRNPIYKGYVRFNQVINWETDRRKGKNDNYIVAKGHHEPIVDEELWEKAQVIANSRATGIPRRYTGSFPLTGLVKCPQCGSFMTSLLGARNKDGKRKRYYVCGAYYNHGKAICKPNLIPADWLEEAVYERLEKTLQSEDILQEITNQLNALIHHNHQEHETEVEILENKLADLEARKKKIQEEFEKGSGLYTESEAYERMAEIRKSIEEIKNALASIQHSNRSVEPWQKKTVTVDQVRSQLSDFLELSHKLEPMEFRQLLQASIEKIEASKYHLKHVHFSFIVYMPEDPTDPRDPLLHIHDKPSILLRAIYFKHSHHLFVVRLSSNNSECAVNLFKQDDSHELMRKCHV